MTTDPFDPPDQTLLRAVCAHCGRFAGEYQRIAGWRVDGKRCSCDPPPELPEGDVLERHIARVRRDRPSKIVVR